MHVQSSLCVFKEMMMFPGVGTPSLKPSCPDPLLLTTGSQGRFPGAVTVG